MDAHVSSTLVRLRRRTGSGLTFLGQVEDDAVLIGRFDGPVVGPLRGARLDRGEGLGGRVFAEGRPGVVADYVGSSSISHHYDHIIRAESLRSMAAAPVIVGRRPVAVLYAAARDPVGETGRLCDAVVDEARALEQDLVASTTRGTALEDSGDELSPQWRARAREAHAVLRSLAATAPHPELRRRALDAAAGLAVGREPSPGAGAQVELSVRETDVLALLGNGLSNRAIAEMLGISLHTVKSHVKQVMTKLDATTRFEAVVTARRRCLLP